VIEKIDMENDRFSAYYKAQKIVPEEEWDTFIDAMRQHLPTTFRVAGSRQYVLHIIPVNRRLRLLALEQPTS
jgi:hypothetical protein